MDADVFVFRLDAAPDLGEAGLGALVDLARDDRGWVEPILLGALLDRALDADRRPELNAHYTPRASVETLVEPTVMAPLRQDWATVRALAVAEVQAGHAGKARARVRAFHRSLCALRVLDPACGAGNILCVALHLMKGLEAEILSFLTDQGENSPPLTTVGPAQFLGLEKNRKAAWIARVVLAVVDLQWRHGPWGWTFPSKPPPGTPDAIRVCDALIACDPDRPARDLPAGPHARAAWPEAEFIVGNPPFMGAKDQRRELGDPYVDALWDLSDGRFRSADLAARWWDRAAEILTAPGSRLRRFGFITTNSITQTFSRRVLAHHLDGDRPMRLVFAIADHPWSDDAGAASVRVAMTVAERGRATGHGRLLSVVDQPVTGPVFREQRGVIRPDLTVGTDVTSTVALKANAGLASRGVQLMGAGFVVDSSMARVLMEGSERGAEAPLRPYHNGRDLTDRPRDVQVIDLFGWDEASVRRRHPGVYQHLLETVKPDRDRNARSGYRDAWWTFGEPRRELRRALQGLERFIVTVETGKHRWFRFLDAEITPDNRLVCVVSDDPFVLGVLSSRVHTTWARATGGLLEDRPVYAKTACFDRFPFPAPTAIQREDIAVLAEDLDRLRREVLERHADLTMTGLYNARERLGSAMTDAERAVHLRGCVERIDHLHTRIDALTIAAYGWPQDIADEAIVARLVELNAARAVEERRGNIRWLRPNWQRERIGPGRPNRQDRAPNGGGLRCAE